jgi:hypothetical protein
LVEAWKLQTIAQPRDMKAQKMSARSIAKLSESLLATHKLAVPEVRDVTIPASHPLTCEVYYKAVRTTSGKVISIHLGDSEIAMIEYNDENGTKRVVTDPLQGTGIVSFRVRLIIARLPLELEGDEAIIWLKNEYNTIIFKKYTTLNPIEPFDQTWNLSIK